MSTRMTVTRLARLVEAGNAEEVAAAVADTPALLTRTVERHGDDGWTPLHLAVLAGSGPVVDVLAAAGAPLDATTEHGRTPLSVALEAAPELVDRLCRLGARIDGAAAAYLGHVDRLRDQLDGGAPLDDRATGVALLTAAALGGSLPAVHLLLERGADVDSGALQAAAASGHLTVVQALLDAGADVDRRAPDTGQAALHAVVAAPLRPDSRQLLEVLLDAGADVDAATSDGATALDITRVTAARDRAGDARSAVGREELGDLLVARGATH